MGAPIQIHSTNHTYNLAQDADVSYNDIGGGNNTFVFAKTSGGGIEDPHHGNTRLVLNHSSGRADIVDFRGHWFATLDMRGTRSSFIIKNVGSYDTIHDYTGGNVITLNGSHNSVYVNGNSDEITDNGGNNTFHFDSLAVGTRIINNSQTTDTVCINGVSATLLAHSTLELGQSLVQAIASTNVPVASSVGFDINPIAGPLEPLLAVAH